MLGGTGGVDGDRKVALSTQSGPHCEDSSRSSETKSQGHADSSFTFTVSRWCFPKTAFLAIPTIYIAG